MSQKQHEAYERFLRAAHRTVFAVDRSADRILKDTMGGTFSRFLILSAISFCPGLSQKMIAEYLDLTPAAVSRQIDSLVSEKLIERAEDPSNRRSHIVTLTIAGKNKLAAMKSLLITSFDQAVHLSETELNAASETMEKVLAVMHPEHSITK